MLITHLGQLQRYGIFLFVYFKVGSFSHRVFPLLGRLDAWLLVTVVFLPHPIDGADLALEVVVFGFYLFEIFAGVDAVLLVPGQHPVLNLKVLDSLCYSAKLLLHRLVSS
jgi:hypothetical protein